jgi:hypothetical protein
MHHLDDDEANNFLNRDMLTMLLGAVFIVFVLAFTHIHKTDVTAATPDQDQNTLTFEIQWAAGSHIDVDLWIEPPGQQPVGYSNKNGQSCNLVRDDMGESDSPIDARYETAFCRGIRDGEYVMNIMLYSIRGGDKPPVAVKWAAKARIGANNGPQVIDSGTAELTEPGQEITLVRFKAHDRVIDTQNLGHAFKKLYGGSAG